MLFILLVRKSLKVAVISVVLHVLGLCDSPLGNVTNCSLLCSRRCGYSKAKQDPEEEKMHFHNGHSKQTVKKKKKIK